jgi:hypothetical protein
MLLTCPERARTVAIALLLITTGCAATSMTAERTRVPILLGPVACIGCPAVPAPAVPYAAPISDTASHWGGTVTFFGSTDISANVTPRIDAKVDAAVPDPCAGEVYISRLKASSFSIFAFLFVTSEEKVEVQAVASPLARGMCGAPGGPPGGAP